MSRGKPIKPTKPKKNAPAGRPKKYNRHLELRAEDVLRLARLESASGHPDDAIPSDAIIETKRVGQGFRYVIRWKGMPTTAPGYQGAEQSPPPKTSAS